MMHKAVLVPQLTLFVKPKIREAVGCEAMYYCIYEFESGPSSMRSFTCIWQKIDNKIFTCITYAL